MTNWKWIFGLMVWAGAATAAQPVITTVAGGGAQVPGDGGNATDAQLESPTSVVVDPSGNLYIAEGADSYTACRVRKVTPAGTISTYAGNGTRNTQGENVPATSVSVCPYALALDAAGNLYIGEHSRVRRVTPGGTITTVAGTGSWGFSGDGGLAIHAQIGLVHDVAVDGAGRLHIVDNASSRIRRVDSQGVIRTIAGNGEFHASGDGGPALAAGMSPRALVADAAGHVVFSDGSNNTVRRLAPSGVVTRLAGNGPFRSDPFALSSDMNYPRGVALDGGGNLYVANQSNIVQLISPAGILKVIAGDYNDSTFSPYGAWWGFGGDGGAATKALLWEPQDVAVDAAGNVYVADTRNHRVRRITPVQAPPVPSSAGAFHPVTRYRAGTYNGALAVGDFNGDRREDVVVVSGSWGGDLADPDNDHRLLLFLQQADGTLAAPLKLAFTPPRYLGRLQAADLNRDGASDLIWATEVGLNLFYGGASGLRTGPVLKGEDNAEVPTTFTVGDMDLDGHPDIVAWMGGQSEGGTSPSDLHGLTVFYGDGQGGVARRRFFQQSIFAGNIAWVDVNRDGRADLVSGWSQDASDSGIAVFMHDGIDGFLSPRLVRLGLGGFRAGLAAGDFDADGRAEIVLSRDQNAPHAELALIEQTADGWLEFIRTWRTYDVPTELVGRDMDGDGRDDLVIHHSGWRAIGYQQQATAAGGSMLDVAVKYAVHTSNRGYGTLATADLNGDGCPDVALSDNNHGLQVLYATACLATPPARAPLIPPGSTDVAGANASARGATTASSGDRRAPRGSHRTRVPWLSGPADPAVTQRDGVHRGRQLAAWTAVLGLLFVLAKLWGRPLLFRMQR